MAASSSTDASTRTGDKDVDSPEETGDRSALEHVAKRDEKIISKTEPETEEPFKKPTVLAAPSSANKRSKTKPSSAQTRAADEDKPAHETASDSAGGDQVLGNGQGADKSCGTEKKKQSPAKCELETKPEVLPVKGKFPPVPGKFPPLPYTEPAWGGQPPDTDYAFEILKNGTVVDTVPLTSRSYFVVGRLPVCDVTLEHPSISRLDFRLVPI